MTILTKAKVQIKKGAAKSRGPDARILVEEEQVETYTKQEVHRSMRVGLLLTVLALMGMCAGVTLLRRYLQKPPHRYQGFCSIPIDTKQLREAQLNGPSFHLMPSSWSPITQPDWTLELATDGDDLVNFLREELDIGDTVEKITVFDNGRQTSFVHDFSNNMTGIVDLDRCFTMELDPALVLPPVAFILSIEAGGKFDVSRARSSQRAVLPALAPLPGLLPRAMPRLCADKPVYHLRPEIGIRKRSAEEPAHYIQFAGRRIQEIEISNLADIIRHEQSN